MQLYYGLFVRVCVCVCAKVNGKLEAALLLFCVCEAAAGNFLSYSRAQFQFGSRWVHIEIMAKLN